MGDGRSVLTKSSAAHLGHLSSGGFMALRSAAESPARTAETCRGGALVLGEIFWYRPRMSIIVLPRNVQFMYEALLARIEAQSFGCERWTPDDDNPWRVGVHISGTAAEVLSRAAYVGKLDGQPTVYEQLIRPNYQGGIFNRTRSVNQYLTHWIYPYRGKFHPQMVRALLNIIGANRGSRILDPYAGSGTTALEASLLGIDCIGVDISPLCVLLTRVKTRSVDALHDIAVRVQTLVENGTVDPHDASIADDDNSIVADFLEVARMTTLSDMARRGRDGRTWLRKNLLAMLDSVDSHARALAAFGITPGDVSAVCGDSRNLRIADIGEATIDGVVTSPPYSIALDYVKNDEHALEALGVSTSALRQEMTGVRGRGPKEKLALYNDDMRRMFSEVARVLKPGAKGAFVIGDATVDRSEYTTTQEMVDWAVDAGLEWEREIPKIVYGLYNVMQDEKILVFRKPRDGQEGTRPRSPAGG